MCDCERPVLRFLFAFFTAELSGEEWIPILHHMFYQSMHKNTRPNHGDSSLAVVWWL